jgi:hypothetical protein
MRFAQMGTSASSQLDGLNINIKLGDENKNYLYVGIT